MADEEPLIGGAARPTPTGVWGEARRQQDIAGATKLNEGIEDLRTTIDSLHSTLSQFATDLRSAGAALRDLATGGSTTSASDSHTSSTRGSSNRVNPNGGFGSIISAFATMSPPLAYGAAGFELSRGSFAHRAATGIGAGIGGSAGGPGGAVVGGLVGGGAQAVGSGVLGIITSGMKQQLKDALANRPGLLTFGALNGLQGYNAGYDGYGGTGQDTYRTASSMLRYSILRNGQQSLNASDLTSAALTTTYQGGGFNTPGGQQFQNAVVQIARSQPGIGEATAAQQATQLYAPQASNQLRMFGLSPILPGGNKIPPNEFDRKLVLTLSHSNANTSQADLEKYFAEGTPNRALVESIYGQQMGQQIINQGITGGVGGKDKLVKATLSAANKLTGQQLTETSNLQQLFVSEVNLSAQAVELQRKISEGIGRLVQDLTGGPVGKALSHVLNNPVSGAFRAGVDLLHGDLSGAGHDLLHGVTFGFVGDPPSNVFTGRIGSSDGNSAVSGMKPQFEQKLAAMFQANPRLRLNSGYRSRAEQTQLYNKAVAQYGAAGASAHVAPPGTSMHEKGLAADIGPPSEYGWLKQNASKYGMSGYAPEPWHYELAGARAGGMAGEDTSNSMTSAGAAANASKGTLSGLSISMNPFASESDLLGLSSSEFGTVFSSGTGGAPIGGGGGGSSGKGGAPAGPSGPTGSYDAFARAVLAGIGAPVNQQTLAAMADWMASEEPAGRGAKFNPMNTTRTEKGASNFNSVGVKNYTSWQQGVQATIDTLNNGRYSSIIAALRAGSSEKSIDSAINASPWGSHPQPRSQSANNAYLGASVVGDPPSMPAGVVHHRTSEGRVTHNWTIKIDRVSESEARRLHDLFKKIDASYDDVGMIGSH